MKNICVLSTVDALEAATDDLKSVTTLSRLDLHLKMDPLADSEPNREFDVSRVEK